MFCQHTSKTPISLGFTPPIITHSSCASSFLPTFLSYLSSTSKRASYLYVHTRTPSFLPPSPDHQHHYHTAQQPVCAFDFLKKASDSIKKFNADAAQERKRATEALQSGRTLQYIKQKVSEDIGKVQTFSDGLAKTREKLARDLSNILDANKDLSALDETLKELEEVLITSDMGVDTTEKILADLRNDARKENLKTPEDIKICLKKSMTKILIENGGTDTTLKLREDGSPTVFMVIGANGMGKTTTIGKLAMQYKKAGLKVLLGACDTFRAAAVDQLEEWAKRAEVDIVKPRENQKNPSTMVYDAMNKAFKEEYDLLILDTAGRLHNNFNLTKELQKMKSVVQKWHEEGPDETILVVDASIGRNAVKQARTWQEDVGISGIAVTKLDGTARAGFVVSVVNELEIPVKLVGIGEKINDLQPFDPVAFVEALVGE